jgi:hypothetical protein
MTGTMYLHHERTIVARWHNDDVPVLDGVDLLPPLQWEAPQESLLANLAKVTQECRSIRLALPTAQTPVHRFPVDDGMAHAQRLFEMDIMQEALAVDPTYFVDLPLSLHRNGAIHEALIVVPEATRAALAVLASVLPIERVFPAIVAEAMALARTFAGPSLRAVLAIGRRNKAWETFTLGDGGMPTHWADHPVDEGSNVAEQILDIAVTTMASLSATIDTVVLYGDGLAKPLFDDIARSSKDYQWKVTRLQPFASVRTTVDAEDRAMLVRVAHMLGPIVGLVHCTPLSIDLPCALPAAH